MNKWKKINHGGNPQGKGYAMFVGRYQTFHNGHKHLIQQKLNENIPVLILVRAVEISEKNPRSALDIAKEIEGVYEREDVIVMVIPDIESINYGRDVGYEVNQWIPPKEIGEISGTKIRNQKKNKTNEKK